MQDTFFLPGGMLLRTHTSNGQIRVMETRKPPLAIVCPGNCYRRDEFSVRASPMFSQIEGFMVDRAGVITMAPSERRVDGISARTSSDPTPACDFARASSRLPSRAPKSISVACSVMAPDAACASTADGRKFSAPGMIHPNVLRAVGYDPAEYQGFAFGMGVERTSLLKLGVDDLRLFFENDMRFLEPVPGRERGLVMKTAAGMAEGIRHDRSEPRRIKPPPDDGGDRSRERRAYRADLRGRVMSRRW